MYKTNSHGPSDTILKILFDRYKHPSAYYVQWVKKMYQSCANEISKLLTLFYVRLCEWPHIYM